MHKVVPRPPDAVHDTMPFKRLKALGDDDGLYSKATRFLDAAIPLIDSISSGPFAHYTLHNRDHAKKLLHLCEYIVAPETLEALTAFEWLLHIYSAFLHDLTLSFSQKDLSLVLDSEAFQNSLQDRRDLRAAIERKRAELESASAPEKARLEIELAELHSVALADYLRPMHATPEQYSRVIKHVRDALGGDDPFSLRGISFENELIDICVSHNLSATVLAEMYSAHRERFPRRFVVADQVANTQFIAAMLRLADILDCDFERTPRVLFQNLGIRHLRLPDAEISLKEWERHLAVQQIEVGREEVVLRATCHHPVIESAVKSFGQEIEKEIRDTLSILKRNPAEVSDRYQLCVPPYVHCDIRPMGYVFMDLRLRLDESAVAGLLMGTRLYPSRYAAVRELLQNGIDACSVRTQLDRTGTYHPYVEISSVRDDDETVWLQVRDNGIGMTEDVLREHFFRVGSSYYSSAGFDRLLRMQQADRIPLISRFGIGFLSVFMLGSTVEVETRRMAMLGTDSVGWRVHVQQHGALAFVQVDNRLPEGTTVRVRLGKESEATEETIDRVLGYLRENVLRPSIEIRVRLKEERFVVKEAEFASLREAPMLVPEAEDTLENIEMVSIDAARYTNVFSGRVFLALAKVPDSEQLDCRLRDLPMDFSADTMVPDRIRLRPKWFFTDFSGNRVSVAGFRMVLKRLNRLLRRGDNVVPAVYDIDLVPGPLVEFDVTRTQVRDHSMALRTEIRRVVVEGLKSQGLFERLTQRARRAIEKRTTKPFWAMEEERLRYKSRFVDDTELLAKVEELLPEDGWPVAVHRDVACRLNIAPRLAYDAISTLLVTRQIQKPSRVRESDI